MTKKLQRSEELKRWQERYARRNREGKVRMLDEFCEQYGYERKYAAKLLTGCLPQPKGACPTGPEPRYEPLREVVEIQAQIAGFDLGEIEDVADQGEQRVARLVDRFGIGALIRAKLAERGAGWAFDLSGAFDGDDYLYIDACHVSPGGNAIIAREIVARIGDGAAAPAAAGSD